MRFPRIFQALFLAAAVTAIPAASYAEVSISVNIGPPALPVYAQPMCPGPDYIWTPGYWAWGPDGYFWVPGTWVMAPEPGLLWTPGYWGWVSSVYVWHPGYWGPHIGFYGGVNYGYGYTGEGYWGGRWEGNHFAYNRVVNNVNVTNIHNVYVDKTVIVNNNVNRVSFNGGPGGVHAAPTAVDMRAAQEHHFAPPAVQVQHEQMARADRNQWASVNHGRPALAAAPRPMTSPAHENFAPANNIHQNIAAPGRGVETRPVFQNPRTEQRQTVQSPQLRQQQTERQAAPQYRMQAPERQNNAPQYRAQQMPQQRQSFEQPQYRQQQPAPQYRQQQQPQYRPQQAPQPRPQEMHQSAPPQRMEQQHMERPPAPSSGGGRPEGEHGGPRR